MSDPYAPPKAAIIAPPTNNPWKKVGGIIGIIWGFISIVAATIFVLIMIYLYGEMGGFIKAWSDVLEKCRESGDQSYFILGLIINVVWLTMIAGFATYGYKQISRSLKVFKTG